MPKPFASSADLAEKTLTLELLADGVHALTAEGDPNVGAIEGEDFLVCFEARATPAAARDWLKLLRTRTDKPVKYLVLTHYHAVRVLGASAYGASEIVAHEATRKLIVERGAEDMASEIGRFPRLFRGVDTVPGLTWPTFTFAGSLTLWLGKRRVEISHPGRGHTAGDTIAWVPDAGVLFSGDLVEYKSACYCGDAFLREWPRTIARLAALDAVALVPGRGDALVGSATVKAAMAGTADFLNALFGTAERAVARGLSLKETAAAIRAEMDKPFGDYAIYEHCLPFNVSRAYDEARGIDWPRIWTDERDVAMWTALQD